MDSLATGYRRKKLRFPGRRASSPHIKTGGSACFAQENRTPGDPRKVLGMTDLYVFNVRK